ncbi:autophagy-related 7 isoform X1 [Rhipicephalus microplus]|uniref:autophagy-related 7 isoform X1 n=2 Tax=Rhipicephalus microplus TaxID=6941 RepID=UPI001887A66A|nr:ubiquitin-like modifier-activating enzyme ATG7 [Rhipicephalus microplus]
MSAAPLQFVPFSSSMDGTFWSELSRRKLVQYRLGEGPFDVGAAYSCGSAAGLPALANLDIGSFGHASGGIRTPDSCPLHGLLYLPNSLANMKQIDKSALLRASGERAWAAACDGRALKDPSLLNRFVVLIYVDLKKYTFCYWFGFPVVRLPEEVTLAKPPQRLSDVFDYSRLTSLNVAYATLDTPEKRAAFLVVPMREEVQIQPLEELPTLVADCRPFYLAFSDPSTSPIHPGWPLRNLLALVVHHYSLSRCSVLCYRRQARHGHVDSSHSLILDVQLCASVIAEGVNSPVYVGWERNAAGKLGPRSVDLSASFDPARLMENALELNLQLMRWRLAPTLDLEAVASAKCLLLGAGTLGCSVARCLISWGVRYITFVDNGVVSYSNPARQSLYTARDCWDGGRPKCDAAAEALSAVSPAVHARGENLRVPMAGHSVPAHAEEHVQADVQRLEALVAEHDAVFLLLDTREARWLPTVVAATQRKIVINAALGFDTFLVMRHGIAGDNGEKLGCYFCSDVVGPADSTRDRTLDQQCTVTRPGVGAMAGALAAELLVGLLQSPLKGRCPTSDDAEASGENPLGLVPHQIRGFLARHVYMMPTYAAFPMCTACSQPVLDEYAHRGWEFVLQVLNDAAYLERLTGLSRLHEETDVDQVWALSDSEESASSGS